MQTAARTSLFLIENLSYETLAGLPTASRQAEFYQQIAQAVIKGVYSRQSINELCSRLVGIADLAYQFRQMSCVEEIGEFLTRLPLPRQYENIGGYYRALSLKKQGETGEARALLERVADEAPLRFRARAIMSLGTTFFEEGDFQSALPFYLEAGRAANYLKHPDPITTIVLQQAYPVLKSIDGDHRGALLSLESMLPLVRVIASEYPFFWYQHLNSLGIELTEVGRIEEAERACQIVLASPFASAYPEWRETSDDIALRRRRKSRSFISFSGHLNIRNVLHIPLPDCDGSIGSEEYSRSPFHQQASITSLQGWKQKMVKEKNGSPNDKELPQ